MSWVSISSDQVLGTNWPIFSEYPMLWEAEDWKMDLYGVELNIVVDSILEKIATFAGNRDIVFTHSVRNSAFSHLTNSKNTPWCSLTSRICSQQETSGQAICKKRYTSPGSGVFRKGGHVIETIRCQPKTHQICAWRRSSLHVFWRTEWWSWKCKGMSWTPPLL